MSRSATREPGPSKPISRSPDTKTSPRHEYVRRPDRPPQPAHVDRHVGTPCDDDDERFRTTAGTRARESPSLWPASQRIEIRPPGQHNATNTARQPFELDAFLRSTFALSRRMCVAHRPTPPNAERQSSARTSPRENLRPRIDRMMGSPAHQRAAGASAPICMYSGSITTSNGCDNRRKTFPEHRHSNQNAGRRRLDARRFGSDASRSAKSDSILRARCPPPAGAAHVPPAQKTRRLNPATAPTGRPPIATKAEGSRNVGSKPIWKTPSQYADDADPRRPSPRTSRAQSIGDHDAATASRRTAACLSASGQRLIHTRYRSYSP